MSTYVHLETNEIRDFDDEWFTAMSASQNPKVTGWLLRPPAPVHSSTQHAPEWVGGQWIISDKTAEEIAAQTAKSWPSKAEFWAEFSDAEKVGILTSNDLSIRMLDKELTMWSGIILATDARVVAGLDKLIELDIISEARRTNITTL